MIALPMPTADPNIRALSRLHRESRTGSTSATWQLSSKPMYDVNDLEASPVFIFKNGLLLQPTTDYSVAGDIVTFAVAPIAGDRTTAVFYFVAQ
jgi:hypothetical protein